MKAHSTVYRPFRPLVVKQVTSVRRGLLCNRSGQGTVEYAVVLAAFMAIVVALGALWHFLDAGTVVQHALQGASHHLQSVTAGAIGDVFQY